MQEGNRWSDYSGSGSYSINDPSNSVDLFPYGRSRTNQTDTQTTIAGYNLGILVIGFSSIILEIILSKRFRKN